MSPYMGKDVIKPRTLSWEITLGDLGGPSVLTGVLIRGRQEGQRERKGEARSRGVRDATSVLEDVGRGYEPGMRPPLEDAAARTRILP